MDFIDWALGLITFFYENGLTVALLMYGSVFAYNNRDVITFNFWPFGENYKTWAWVPIISAFVLGLGCGVLFVK